MGDFRIEMGLRVRFYILFLRTSFMFLRRQFGIELLRSFIFYFILFFGFFVLFGDTVSIGKITVQKDPK